jgi:threonine/homoserine/homoserine lactone efflux protein
VQTSRLDDQPARSGWASYRQGFVVGASNPKVALFFIAFFPQFVRPERGSATAQTLVLGTIFVTLGLLADFTNAAGSSAIGSWLSRRPALLRVRGRIEGVTYAGLGTWSLLGGSGSRASS